MHVNKGLYRPTGRLCAKCCSYKPALGANASSSAVSAADTRGQPTDNSAHIRESFCYGAGAGDLQTRRGFLITSTASLAVAFSAQPSAAETLTLQDVTPSTAAAGSLSAREQAVIAIFETATPAVVTVFDTTLIVRVSDE